MLPWWVLPAAVFATACRAGCHLWCVRGCRLVCDCGLPGPVLIGLFSGPLWTRMSVRSVSSLQEGD